MLKQCIIIIREIQNTNLQVTMDKLRLETADGVRSIQYIYACWDSSGGGMSSRLEPLIIMALCLGYPQTGWRTYLTGMSLWHVVEEISIDTHSHARSSLHSSPLWERRARPRVSGVVTARASTHDHLRDVDTAWLVDRHSGVSRTSLGV